MSLRLPSEIVAEQFVPTARAMLAVELDERGLTQQEIADHLGVSQAAVSKHLNEEVALETRFAENRQLIETVDRIADGFADGTMDEVDAMAELLGLVRAFEDRGPICELHEEAVPALEGLGCDLCVRGVESNVLTERNVLTSVRQATRILSDGDRFSEHVPNVGTNVGTALPGATDSSDVAAIPGRIIRLRDRIEVPANPEFGASEHVATTILAAMAVDSDVRGALNISTSDSLLAAAREAGIDPLEFDPEYDDRQRRLEALFRDRGAVPSVCYHRGAFGIEPVAYVLGATAVEAAELAVELTAAADRSEG